MPRGNPMGYLNQNVPPQPGQQGGAAFGGGGSMGRPQGPPPPGSQMGMQGAPGGPNPSPPGGGAPPGGGYGSRGSAPDFGFADRQAQNWRGFGTGQDPNRDKLQGAIDDLQQQLMTAQIQGAPPQVIAGLQMQMQQAQRAYQEAGAQAMYGMMQGRPQPGARGVGGGPNPYDAQRQDDWANQLQLLQALWGLGGGGGPGLG